MWMEWRAVLLLLTVLLGGAAVEGAELPAEPRQLSLSQSQEDALTLALSTEPAQTVAGYFGQPGSTPPEKLAQKPLPEGVTAIAPELARYLFAKLPDRILLIDPDSRHVAAVVGEPATTGTGPSESLPASPGVQR
jgi:hypothetical protein